MIVMTAVMLITKSKNIEMKGARGNIGNGRDKSRIKKKGGGITQEYRKEIEAKSHSVSENAETAAEETEPITAIKTVITTIMITRLTGAITIKATTIIIIIVRVRLAEREKKGNGKENETDEGESRDMMPNIKDTRWILQKFQRVLQQLPKRKPEPIKVATTTAVTPITNTENETLCRKKRGRRNERVAFQKTEGGSNHNINHNSNN